MTTAYDQALARCRAFFNTPPPPLSPEAAEQVRRRYRAGQERLEVLAQQFPEQVQVFTVAPEKSLECFTEVTARTIAAFEIRPRQYCPHALPGDEGIITMWSREHLCWRCIGERGFPQTPPFPEGTCDWCGDHSKNLTCIAYALGETYYTGFACASCADALTGESQVGR